MYSQGSEPGREADSLISVTLLRSGGGVEGNYNCGNLQYKTPLSRLFFSFFLNTMLLGDKYSFGKLNKLYFFHMQKKDLDNIMGLN